MTLTAKRLAEEEAEIRRALDSANLPPSVIEYRLTLGEDWTGDPAVFIYFILDDSVTEKKFLQDASEISQNLLNLLPDVSPRIHYPSFRRKAEQQEIDSQEIKGRRSR